ncbi:flap endonuclease GEN homolog 1-like [Saccoglossus kowalevskii]
MGVTDLWPILAPVKSHKSLDELRGQTIAVDLSVWICENQGVKQMMGVVTKPHLRNLFFRASHLTRLGIDLIFVIEGEPPDLKWEEMMKRTEARYGSRGGGYRRGRGGGGGGFKKPSRSHFKGLLNECCTMLDYLGIPYLQSAGEAEAMCALLNAEGVADACITQDGDAFLYGARTVYRNFTINTKDPSVDCYSMDDIEKSLNLNQNKLVALALLLGCDYVPKGVPGVGKENAMKLMQYMGGVDVLQRFEDWAKAKGKDLDTGPKLSKLPHCGTCHHPGSTKEHVKHGCKLCDSTSYCEPQPYDLQCPCEWHQQQTELMATTIERDIKRKALTVSDFPNRKVIKEFLVSKDICPTHTMKWKRPILYALQKFNYMKMEWPEEYTLEKVVPLITLWDLRDIIKGGSPVTGKHLEPIIIVKTRVQKGVPCLEVQWKKPDNEPDSDESKNVYTTIEIEELFVRAFPQMVADFFEKKKSKPKKKSSKKNAFTDLDLNAAIASMEALTVNEDVSTMSSAIAVKDSTSKPSETDRKITPNKNVANENVLHCIMSPCFEKDDGCHGNDAHSNGSDDDDLCVLSLSDRLKVRPSEVVKDKADVMVVDLEAGDRCSLEDRDHDQSGSNMVARERIANVIHFLEDKDSCHDDERSQGEGEVCELLALIRKDIFKESEPNKTDSDYMLVKPLRKYQRFQSDSNLVGKMKKKKGIMRTQSASTVSELLDFEVKTEGNHGDLNPHKAKSRLDVLNPLQVKGSHFASDLNVCVDNPPKNCDKLPSEPSEPFESGVFEECTSSDDKERNNHPVSILGDKTKTCEDEFCVKPVNKDIKCKLSKENIAENSPLSLADRLKMKNNGVLLNCMKTMTFKIKLFQITAIN